MLFSQDQTHVSKVIINKSYEKVWAQLSNPENYTRLYPNWVKAIKKVKENRYLVDDQFGNSYEMEIRLNKDFGIIDLQIGVEASRARLMPLDSQATVIVHLAKKWEGINALAWFFHKRTTDKDFINAKKVLENKL